MSFTEVNENNTFEWKMDHFNDDNDQLISDEFTIHGYSFYFFANIDSGEIKIFLVRRDSKFLPFSYTLSLLNREGQDYITIKSKIMWCENHWSLIVLDVNDLMKHGIIDRDSFTIRFTKYRGLDVRERPHITEATASNDAGSTSRGKFVVTKESSTNTATASNDAGSTSRSNSVVTKESSTNTDGDHINLLEILSNDFSTFYENKTNTDCVLKVSDDQFHVHRAVLSARSSVFSAMFHHDTSENRSGEVNIPDIKATALSDVLYYMYSGKIRSLTADTAAFVYTAADKYDLPELRTECLEYLKREITMDNFCEIAILAHTHVEMELEDRVVWFIEEKLDEVLESDAWQQFLRERTLIASKLLTSALKTAKKKQFRDVTSK